MATPEIRDAMLDALPSLRAFAISLTSNRDAADDLVQDSILRAWTSTTVARSARAVVTS